jgi:CBS domain-containing protein
VICHGCGRDNIPGSDHCEECGLDLAGLDLPEARGGFRGKLLNDRLVDVGLSTPVVVDVSAPVREAIEAMRQGKCGCALVFDKGRLVGIFDESDVFRRVVVAGIDPETTKMSQVMSRDPLHLSLDDPPAYAVHCMVARDFRHMAVFSGDELAGYVSVRNILAYLEREVIAAES